MSFPFRSLYLVLVVLAAALLVVGCSSASQDRRAALSDGGGDGPQTRASASTKSLKKISGPRRFCAAGACGYIIYGWNDQLVPESPRASWNDQIQVNFQGQSFLSWRNVRPYRVCLKDRWHFRAGGQGIRVTAPFMAYNFAFNWTKSVAGRLAFLYYDGGGWRCNADWRINNPRPGQGRYNVEALCGYQYCDIDYLKREQWVKVFPTKRSMDTGRPALDKYLSRSADIGD